MRSIVAVDENWGIGKDNKLLLSIPADMRFFRDTTTNKVVVMGRKTLESFPNGKPLPQRVNIVLSTNPAYQPKGVLVAHSREELLSMLEAYPPDDVYLIGGAGIYQLLNDVCTEALVTKIQYAYEADCFFPNLDEQPDWELAEEGEEQTYFDIEYKFTTYRKVQ
ncbi:MAG: dihydrofolate reductase [Lachnospiraceae bacterium]